MSDVILSALIAGTIAIATVLITHVTLWRVEKEKMKHDFQKKAFGEMIVGLYKLKTLRHSLIRDIDEIDEMGLVVETKQAIEIVLKLKLYFKTISLITLAEEYDKFIIELHEILSSADLDTNDSLYKQRDL